MPGTKIYPTFDLWCISIQRTCSSSPPDTEMRGAATEEATAAAEPAGPLESTERWGQAAWDDSHFSIERNRRFDRSELLHLYARVRDTYKA